MVPSSRSPLRLNCLPGLSWSFRDKRRQGGTGRGWNDQTISNISAKCVISQAGLYLTIYYIYMHLHHRLRCLIHLATTFERLKWKALLNTLDNTLVGRNVLKVGVNEQKFRMNKPTPFFGRKITWFPETEPDATCSHRPSAGPPQWFAEAKTATVSHGTSWIVKRMVIYNTHTYAQHT